MREKAHPIASDSDRFLIRMPEGMRHQIKELALKNRRTMTAEIIARLEQSLGFPVEASSKPSWPRLARDKEQLIISEPPSGTYSAENSERLLLDWFRTLSREKQRAILELLK